MTSKLMLAILSLDSYNRGYDEGLDKLGGVGSRIGNFTFSDQSAFSVGSDERDAGFYAAGYTATGGEKVIGYRGTDSFDPLAAQSDIWSGWTLGAGLPSASQGVLAAKFFQDFTGRSLFAPTVNDVTLTGHSLGGGLAGFVGTLSGNAVVGFDHMPFGAAALAQFLTEFRQRAIDAEHDPDLYPPTPENIAALHMHLPTFANFEGIALEDEVNFGLRTGLFAGVIGNLLGVVPGIGPFMSVLGTSIASGQVAAEQQLQMEVLSTFGWENVDPIDRHSMATLVLMQYAWERELQGGVFANWHYGDLGGKVLDALYDNDVAAAAGANDAGKFSGGMLDNGDLSGILRTTIAYSAIDEGETVFGDTAISSLFDDAVDLGMAMGQSGEDGLIYKVTDHLSKVLAEFAGRLAFNSVKDADNDLAMQGVLHLAENQDTLTVDFSTETWEVGPNYNNKLSSFKSAVLDTAVANSVGWSDFNSALFEYAGSIAFQGEMTRLITSISFGTNADPESLDISLPSNPVGLNALFLYEGTGANAEGSGQDRMIVGTSAAETITGGAQRDLILGGAGMDVLIGGGGDDIIYGGAEADIVTYAADQQPITIDVDGTGAKPSITVTSGASGMDTLHGIERIVGTTGRDFVNIIGQIAAGTDLTIDANGGQGASPRDIISLSHSAVGTTVTIDGNGNGAISSGVGREIKLVGFHTTLIGSGFDDNIEDDSEGEKQINGGAGNDHISISGSNGGSLLVGGEGDDIITGGSGNDVIMGGNGSFVGYAFTPGYDPLYVGNQMFGGSGSDYIVSVSEYDYIEGGDGADYIELRYGLDRGENSTDNRVDAGAGNDVIDLRHRYTDHGYTNGRGAHLVFGAGSGNDVVLGNFNNSVAGKYNQVNLILNNVSVGQLSLVWNVTLSPTGYFTGSGDLAIVTPTGDSIYIPNVYGHISVLSSGTNITLFNVLVDGSYEFENFSSISVGGVSQYLGAVEEFFGNTSAPGDVTGGAGNDHLAGSDGDDQVVGGAGDDTIEGSLGADEIDGGDGADTLELFGSVSDFQFRYEGSELVITNVTGIYGEIRATSVEYIDFLSSGQIYNTQGDLFGYIGTEANDFLIGSAVANNMIGLGGADSISGGGGGDFIDGGAGDDILDGGSGDDELAGGAGTDELLGGNGNDLLRGGAGADQILGGAGIDTADYSSSSEAVQVALGGSANGGDAAGDLLTDIENLTGSSYDDTLEGNAGNNILTGGYGNDLLVGGDGTDQANYTAPLLELLIGRNLDGSVTVTGSIYSPGDTLIGIEVIHSVADNLNLSVSGLPIGTEGNDIIVGSQYSDILNGFGGDDVISTGGGFNHLIDGGSGIDQVKLAGSSTDYSVFIDPDGAVNVWDVTGFENYSMATLREIESIHFDGDNSTLQISSLPPVGTSGNDHIIGSSRNDVLIGLEGDDHLEGNGANDTLSGEAGEDLLEGGDGSDELYGGDGNDTLEGGSGDDYLVGGDGIDVAIFAGNQADYMINIVDGVGQVEDLDQLSDGADGVDSLEGVETLVFKDGSVSLNSSFMRMADPTGGLGEAPTLSREKAHSTFVTEGQDPEFDDGHAWVRQPELELDASLERGGRYRMKHAFDVPGQIVSIDPDRYAMPLNGAVQAAASAFVQSIAAFTPVAAAAAISEHSEDHSRRDLWFAESRAGNHLSSI